MTSLLSVRDLTAGYGGVPVIEDIQLELPKFEGMSELNKRKPGGNY